MTEWKYIEPDQLRKWWMSVKPGLDKIKSVSSESWIVEDVYTDCWNQKSGLWVGLEDSHFKAFFIVQPLGEELHIWCAWTLENDYQMVQKGLQFIKNMARESGNKYLTFTSHRPGWDRRAKAFGFRPRKWISEV